MELSGGGGNPQLARSEFVLRQRRELTVAFILLGALLVVVSLDALLLGLLVRLPGGWPGVLISVLLLAAGSFLLLGGLRHWLRPPAILVAGPEGIRLCFDGASLRREPFSIPWSRVERLRFISQPADSVRADTNGRAGARHDAFRESVAIVVHADEKWDPGAHFQAGYDAASHTFAIDAQVGQIRGGELFAELSEAQRCWGAAAEQAE